MNNISKIFALVCLSALSACSAKFDPLAPIALGAENVKYIEAFDHDNPLSPFISATLAERDSNDILAANYYLRALEHDPESLFIAEKAFFQLAAAGQIDQALELAPGLLDVQSIAPLSRLVLATHAVKQHNGKETLLHAAEIKKTPIGYFFGPLMQAWGYAMTGDETAAFAALDTLSGNQAVLNLAKAHKAYIYDYLEKAEDADAAYKSILANNSLSSLQPIAAYGDFLYRHGRGQEARDMFAQELRKHNNNFILREAQRQMIGYGASLKVATPEGALAHFYYLMATEGYRDRPDPLTLFYARLSEYLAPISDDIKMLIGDILMKIERPSAAARAFASIPSNSLASQVAFFRKIDAFKLAENYGEAQRLIRKKLLDQPDERKYLTMLADLYRLQGNCAQSILYYDQIIGGFSKLESNQWPIYFSRGSCYDTEGDWARAQADLLLSLKLVPDNAMVQNYLGYSWLSRGIKLEQAKKLIEKAADQEPENGSIIDSLGWVQFKTHDYEDALITLERALRLSPNNATINDHLGDTYWRLGRLREARFSWRHALVSTEADQDRVRIRDKMTFGLPEEK